eukprot:CAMPEP_0172828932 /NCGR_PEP_ID=MMETSP1075-20121228/21176_1 /TAXON_ID=2916 /ORGANISM="Ceratium fusus, Strain PA161109" /LENGTH=289 /DNA_ID=CAMNT_0013670995 /DNA_START=195 /DNA_END=1064 /DNA_ORIENTATION=-
MALPLSGLIVSKVLSAGVIAGSLLGKLPQVHAIYRARSADGLSTLSIWAEAASLGIQFAYNVIRLTPLSTYLEVPILFAQLILLTIVAAWADGYLDSRVWSGVAALVVGTLVMALGIVPAFVTAWLYAANAVFGIAICAPQVVMNWRSRSTGRLSLVVSAMTFGGLTTRLFTTCVEVQDPALLLSVGLNWLLMAMLMSQFLLFPPAMPSQETADTQALLKLDAVSGMKKSESMVSLVSRIGSSRCIYLLGDETADDDFTLEVLRHRSKETMKSFPSFGSFCHQLEGQSD